MSAPTPIAPTPDLADLMAGGPLLSSEEAAAIAEEFYAVRRQNEIREWNPAICGLVAHIFRKVHEAGTFATDLREKARTAADKRQIEVPVFSYTRTFLVGETKPWDPITEQELTPDGDVLYTYNSTVGDVCMRHETTIASLDSWAGGPMPLAHRFIPLRKLLAYDTAALGMLSVLLGPNIKVTQRLKPAHITTERYTVCQVDLVAKMFLLREGQVIPLGESFDRTRALQKWFPTPVEVEVPSCTDVCGYEWCDGSCGC